MKKFVFLVLVLFLAFLMVGCGSDTSKYTFMSQGIEVSISADATLRMSFEDAEPTSTIAVFDSGSDDYKGTISISLLEANHSLDELCDLYLSGDGEKKKTVVTENLLFVDSYPASGEPNDWYFFILNDEELQAVLFGRFSAPNNNRDTILALANSIHLEKTKKESPYPSDYSLINPEIYILSSNEEVTEYCTVVKSWKNKEYDLPSYKEVLKDKKVYLLSEDLDNIVFANREHKATTFNAKTSFSESPLFYEGANGFRISRPADIGDEEFYVLLNAEYGNSGELTYVFKCRFQ